jgi:hypothetical protein
LQLVSFSSSICSAMVIEDMLKGRLESVSSRLLGAERLPGVAGGKNDGRARASSVTRRRNRN